MVEMVDGLRVVDNPKASRYELWNGERLLGFADYRTWPDRVLFPYVEIDEMMQGRGFGSILTAAALDDCRARGLRVEATCPFVVDFLRQHPEYDDIRAGA
jgi:uncharacterized protein